MAAKEQNSVRKERLPFVRGEKVRYKPTGEIYEFGYWGREGHAIVYEPGEMNMQDALAIRPSNLEKID